MSKKRNNGTVIDLKNSPSAFMRRLREAFLRGVQAVGQGKVMAQVEIEEYVFRGNVSIELPGILAMRSELENFICSSFDTSVDPAGFMYIRSQEYSHPLAVRVFDEAEGLTLVAETGLMFKFRPDAEIDSDILEAFSQEGEIAAQAVLLVMKVVGELLLEAEDYRSRNAG